MAKVIPLPVAPDGPLAIPLSDGALLRLVPCRESPHVLLALYGPRGGNAGGVMLHADRAQLLGEWLVRLAAQYGVHERGRRKQAAAGAPALPVDLEADLGTILDVEAVGARLASLAVPSFADWWALDVLERKGKLRRLAVGHADASKQGAARGLKEYPPDPQAQHPRSEVLRTGRPNVAYELSDGRIVAAARSPEHLAIMRSLGCRSSLTVPLLQRRRVIGLMTFATAESGRRYDDTHVSMAVAFAREAALAVGNALAYRRAGAALRRLQHDESPRRPRTTGSR